MRKQNLLGAMRHSIIKYSMINDSDSIAVGISGGKDSSALLLALKQYQRFSPEKFNLHAVSIDPGFNNFNTEIMREFCKKLEVPLYIVHTDIAKVVFDIRQEKNPCSLCANMRRGALATKLKELGIKKLALGHHEDDLINTFLMNLLYTGRVKTLEAVSFLSKSGITLIRPLIDTSEKTIISFVDTNKIPIFKNPCPVDKSTSRALVADFAKTIYKQNPNAKSSLLKAVKSIVKIP